MSKSKPNKNAFDKLLGSLEKAALDEFIRTYSSKNKNFKQDFELFFADKNSSVDIETQYKKHLQSIVKKFINRGYLDYRESALLSKEIGQLLETGRDNARKFNFRSAFAVATAVSSELLEVIMYSDDSSGRVGDRLMEAIDLLETIADSDEAAMDIKEQLFTFLLQAVNNKDYFDYGDFGYQIFYILSNLSFQLNQPEKVLNYINGKLAEAQGENDGYEKEYFQKCKILFLEQMGRADEAQLLIQKSLDIKEVRQQEVNNAIARKDFAAAKDLIAEGIRIAESKNHPGTVSQWQKELLRIAVLEKDITTVRYFSKQFAFDHWFSEEYYQQWKKTFSPSEWKAEIEKHIETTIQAITKEWSSSKNKLTRSTYPPILKAIAPVYIQEDYIDRLLPLVQQDGQLSTILKYQRNLIEKYPAEVIAMYIPVLEQYGLSSSTRDHYAYLVGIMEQIIKDLPQGKEEVLNVARRLKARFSVKPRRPAMLEELNRLLQE